MNKLESAKLIVEQRNCDGIGCQECFNDSKHIKYSCNRKVIEAQAYIAEHAVEPVYYVFRRMPGDLTWYIESSCTKYDKSRMLSNRKSIIRDGFEVKVLYGNRVIFKK